MNKEELQEELEELSLHLADMLEVAFYYAGVEKKDLEKAGRLYMKYLDEVLPDDSNEFFTKDDIIKVIEYVKTKHPELFKKK